MKSHSPARGAGVRRRHRSGRHVVVGAAGLVPADEEGRVVGVGALGGVGRSDRAVDAREEVLAGEDRGRRVDRDVDVAADQRSAAAPGGSRRARQTRTGSIRLKSGSVPLAASCSNSENGTMLRRQTVLEPGHVDPARERDARRFQDVDLPRASVRLQPVEQRLGGVLLRPLHRRAVDHEARRGPGGPERTVHERLRGHLAEPVIEDAEALGHPAQHRHLLGRVAGHDLGVLLVGRLAADLAGEGADVVGDEAVHRRLGPRRRDVPRRGHGLADLEAVVLVERVVELGVGVEVLLARVRVRRVHVVGDRVGHDLALGAVLGPLGDRVAEVLADHALERLAVLGSVQVTEEVVERAVLEQDQDDMVHGL